MNPSPQGRIRKPLALLLALGLLAAAAQAQAPAAPQDAQAQANSIADSSRDLRASARLLRQRGVAAAPAFRALRSVFAPADRDNWQALLAGGYTRTELAQALRESGPYDAAGLERKLAEIGEDLDSRALLLRSVFNLPFDELLALLHRGNPNRTNNFLPALRAMQFPLDTIVQTGQRYYGGHLLTGADGRPYPGPAALYVMARTLQPSAQHYDLWARLIRAGYPRNVLFSELTLGETDARAVPRDEVAICIAQHFPRAADGVNPRILLGAGEIAARRGCYARFAARLRAQGVDRSGAAGVAELGIDCAPAVASRCAAERGALLDSILAEAGYPPAPR